MKLTNNELRMTAGRLGCAGGVFVLAVAPLNAARTARRAVPACLIPGLLKSVPTPF